MQSVNWRRAPLVLALVVAAIGVSAIGVNAQQSDGSAFGAPSGPGQAVSQPAAQCAQTIACTYQEQNLIPAGYRFQSLNICGANCTTQYWISGIADGQQLLEIDPVRGGAVVAFAQASGGGEHPQARVVQASYAANDPACCPSSYSDTTYTYDAASNTLQPGEPVMTAAADFPGWDAARQELQAEGWLVAGG